MEKRGPKEIDPLDLIQRMHDKQMATPGLSDHGVAALNADNLPGDRKTNIDRLRKRLARDRRAGRLDATNRKVAEIRVLAANREAALARRLAATRAELALAERKATALGIPIDGPEMDAYAASLGVELEDLHMIAKVDPSWALEKFVAQGVSAPDEVAEQYGTAIRRFEENERGIDLILAIKALRREMAFLLNH